MFNWCLFWPCLPKRFTFQVLGADPLWVTQAASAEAATETTKEALFLEDVQIDTASLDEKSESFVAELFSEPSFAPSSAWPHLLSVVTFQSLASKEAWCQHPHFCKGHFLISWRDGQAPSWAGYLDLTILLLV